MEIDKIKELYNDAKAIQTYLLELNQGKYGDERYFTKGFNVSGVGDIAPTHKIAYSAYTTNAPSFCNVNKVLTIERHKEFWKFFDLYLNRHQDEILDFIKEHLLLSVKKRYNVIKQEEQTIEEMRDAVSGINPAFPEEMEIV